MGDALRHVGYDPAEFVLVKNSASSDSIEHMLLKHRNTSESYAIGYGEEAQDDYIVEVSEPGTSRSHAYHSLTWSEVINELQIWA